MSAPDIRVGDTVKVGNGKRIWTVTGFWTHGYTRFAELARPDRADVQAPAVLTRLTVIERPAPITAPCIDAAKAGA